MQQEIEAHDMAVSAKDSTTEEPGTADDNTMINARHAQLGSRSNQLTLGLLEDQRRGDPAFHRLESRVLSFISLIAPEFQSYGRIKVCCFLCYSNILLTKYDGRFMSAGCSKYNMSHWLTGVYTGTYCVAVHKSTQRSAEIVSWFKVIKGLLLPVYSYCLSALVLDQSSSCSWLWFSTLIQFIAQFLP